MDLQAEELQVWSLRALGHRFWRWWRRHICNPGRNKATALSANVELLYTDTR